MLSRRFAFAAVILSVVVNAPAQAQRARDPQLYLTIFRNPSSGIELRVGQIGVHAGFYPTILKADDETKGKNTNFLRFGATMYSAASGTALYLSPSVVVSLDKRFRSGFLTDAGVRGRIAGPVAGRIGIGMLNTFDGEVRVNPTVGLDVRLGRAK